MGLLDDEPVPMRRPMIALEILGAMIVYEKLRNQFPRPTRELRWFERVDWPLVLGGEPLEVCQGCDW